MVGSDKPSAAQRGGRHLLDKHPDIKLGYSDIAQRVNILDSGGRRVDGDGSWDGDLDVLLGSDGTMAVLALLLLNAGDVDGTLKTSRDLT